MRASWRERRRLTGCRWVETEEPTLSRCWSLRDSAMIWLLVDVDGGGGGGGGWRRKRKRKRKR